MTQRFHLTLADAEIAALYEILESGSNPLQRRARIILMTADEIPQVDIASAIELSERQVRRWQRAFQKQRMAIFERATEPPQTTETGAPAPQEPHTEAGQPDETDVPNFAEGAPSSAESALAEIEHQIPDPAPPPKPKVIVEPGISEPRRELTLAKNSGILPDDPMSEAGRKALLYHFERMLLNEPGSRLGEDIEAVHDMRVSTRRMRSAFQVFGPFYRTKTVKPFIGGLRRTARILGAVRDLDVFLEKLDIYRADLPGNGEGSLNPLIDMIHIRRDEAREALIRYLDSTAFSSFVEEFDEFLNKPGAGQLRQKESVMGTPPAYLVRHVAPRLIYTNYEAVRAYETVLDHARIETLHALRIEFKRLRYALEFFEEVLGPEARTVIREVKRVQDHLGDLNDAQVAGDFLRDFISEHEQAQSTIMIQDRQSIERVVQYMAYQFAEKHRLTTTFAETWTEFNRTEIRRSLALAISEL